MLKGKIKKLEAIVLAVAMLFSMMAGSLTVQAAEDGDAVGTSYYLDAENGDDNAAGTSPSTAWKSLDKLKGITFQPGDKILLKAGSQFTGGLQPQGSGTAENPITVDIYSGDTIGTDAGSRAVINGEGQVRNTIFLENLEYWNINNLEITNTGAAREARAGVMVEINEEGVYDGIHLNNLFVHDVNGDIVNKSDNGGIYYINRFPGTLEGTEICRYNDISVQNCYVKDVSRTGISIGWFLNSQFIEDEYSKNGGRVEGKIPDLIDRFYNTNVVIRNNYVENAGGDAIVPMYSSSPLIEYNISNRACKDMPEAGNQYSAAIWPWRCIDSVFQFNEAYDSVINGDGQAYDCDWSVGTTYQYNYSHDNEGGFMLVCQAQVLDSVIRYNVSQNDLRSIFMLSNTNMAEAYNNTIYVKEGTDIYANYSGKLNLQNNIFYYAGETPANANWSRNGTYDNNLYYGFANVPENDANAIVADPMMVDPGKGGDGVYGDSAIDTLDGYRLQAGSPAIDAGKVIEDNGGRDYAGNPLDDHPDIGAFEFVDWSIEDLEALYNENVDRDTTGCTESSKTRFENALAAAKAVLDKAEPTVEEISAAYGELKQAAEGLQLKGDTTELKAKYDEYLALRSHDYEYSTSSWEAVEKAAEAAKAVLDSADPGKQDVDEALAALTAALEALEPAECNLLANGTFENADINKNNEFDFGQWSTSAGSNGAYRVNHDAHTGEYAAEFIGPGAWGIWMEQKVAVEPNTTYRIGAWIKLRQEGDPEPLALGVNPSAGNKLLELPAASTEYGYVEGTFTTGADETWVKVYIGSNGQGGYADDVVLVKDTDKETLTKRYEELRNKNSAPYSEGSWANLQEALRVAGGVLMDAAASQEEIDAAVAGMNEAEAALVNISTLEYVLGIANGHVEAGDVDKLIPTAQEQFNKVLSSAQAIYDDPNATQEQVDNAWSALIDVIQALGFVPGDKTELAKLVESMKTVDLDAYEDGAEKDAFKEALAEAEALLKDDDAMELDIEAAIEALEDAFAALKPLPEVGDKSELKKAIDVAEGHDLSLYVDDANKESFLEILAEAKDMYDNNDTASQAEIDAMTKKLLDATVSLRLRADKETLNKWLEALKGLDLSRYTEASAAAVRAAIANAEALAAEDLGNDQQALIQAAIAQMQNAYNGLELSAQEPEPNDPGDNSSSSGKPATGDTPTTGDSAPVAALSVMAIAAAGAVLLIKKRRNS